jgi:hypothetical protein
MDFFYQRSDFFKKNVRDLRHQTGKRHCDRRPQGPRTPTGNGTDGGRCPALTFPEERIVIEHGKDRSVQTLPQLRWMDLENLQNHSQRN